MSKFLGYPKRTILLNSVSHDDIGVYGDTTTKLRTLVFKKEGVQMPGAAFATNDIANPVIGTSMDSMLSISKNCTDPGAQSGYLVELNPECPCEECDYDYGITLVKKVEKPGVGNSDRYKKEFYYGSSLSKIDCTGGLIDDAELLTMEKSIITDIYMHQPKDGADNTNILAHAKRVYYVTDSDPADASSIDVTLATGVTTTVTSGGGFGIDELIIAFNATAAINTVLFAYKVGANQMGISSVNDGYLFTVVANTDTVVDKRYIYLFSKSVDVQFDVKIDNKFGTVIKANFLVFSTWTKLNQNLQLVADGTSANVSENGATANAFLTALNAGLATVAGAGHAYAVAKTPSGVNAYTTGDVYVYFDTTVSSYRMNLLSTSTIVKSQEVVGDGRYSRLTADEIFKMFANTPHMGWLSNMVRGNQPAAGIEFCSYLLTSQKHVSSGPHLANEMTIKEQEIMIIIPKSLIATNLYQDVNDDRDLYDFSLSGTPLDMTFEKLLEVWASCTIANW